MQPILAESAPHRGRAIVFAILLAIVALVALVALAPAQHHRRMTSHRHYWMAGTGKCPQGKYVGHHYQYVRHGH